VVYERPKTFSGLLGLKRQRDAGVDSETAHIGCPGLQKEVAKLSEGAETAQTEGYASCGEAAQFITPACDRPK